MHALSVIRTVATPVIALLLTAAVWNRTLPPALLLIVSVALVAAVLVAVHHAEVVAHRVGEPFGSLVLAVAVTVTVIEVGLILSVMFSGGPDTASLPRDTVFAAVMITTNGVVGICLLIGALRHHVVSLRTEGSSGALAAVLALSTLCLVLPTFTTRAVPPACTNRTISVAGRPHACVFASIATVIIRHRPIGDCDCHAALRPRHRSRHRTSVCGVLVLN